MSEHGGCYKEIFIVEGQRIVHRICLLLMPRIFVFVILMLHMKWLD